MAHNYRLAIMAKPRAREPFTVNGILVVNHGANIYRLGAWHTIYGWCLFGMSSIRL